MNVSSHTLKISQRMARSGAIDSAINGRSYSLGKEKPFYWAMGTKSVCAMVPHLPFDLYLEPHSV